MYRITKEIGQYIADKMIQYSISIAGGLLAAFEASIVYVGLCYIAIVIDVISAWCLSRRIHKKDPSLSDGKFKSSYKFRILITLIVVQLAIMAGYYVDTLVMNGGNMAQNFVIVFFLFYEGWSIGENWSSENSNPMAKVFQKIMVNKAERHFNVDLSELKKEDKDNGENDTQ